MAAPDPESVVLLAQVIGAGVAIGGPIWVARSWLEKRFNGKVSKDDFKEYIARFDQHARDDREVQAKLFDKVDEVKTLLIERMPK